jgi:hypothetical protein
MHRFVWNLIWGSSGGPDADEESEYSNPHGPKVVPGTYQVRLTVDGKTQSQPLKIVMDPRSPATTEVLAQQFQLGQQIFGETVAARRVLSEIGQFQERLADLQQKFERQKPVTENARLKSVLVETQSAIAKILNSKEHAAGDSPGLEDAYTGLASALRVIESGDRITPSQAIAVYQESSWQVKERIAEWTQFKQVRLQQLDRQLREAGLSSIQSSETE